MSKPLSAQDRKILQAALCDTPQLLTPDSRQAFIRNELRGYPKSGEIEKTLRHVRWASNDTFIFADSLISLLNTAELDIGVPALALIAQAIQPMADAEHHDKIAALRQRMGWTTDISPDQWQDLRTPAELNERIIGENTLKHLYFLRRALAAADAVVRIDRAGTPIASGFLVAPTLIMTNHHVVASQAEAAESRAAFFDELRDPQNPRASSRDQVFARFTTHPIYTSKALDFTLLRIPEAPPGVRPLTLRPALLTPDHRVNIIQHPAAREKQISLQNNFVAAATDVFIQYYTSTLPGSSGSPVFDDNFAVVAIHRGSHEDKAWNAAPQLPSTPAADIHARNHGTSMIAIQRDVETHAPEFCKELTFES